MNTSSRELRGSTIPARTSELRSPPVGCGEAEESSRYTFLLLLVAELPNLRQVR